MAKHFKTMLRSITRKPDTMDAIVLKVTVVIITLLGVIGSIVNLEYTKALLIFLPAALVGFFALGQRGILIDPERRRYKVYKTFLLWEYGDWKRLPPINRIVLKCTNEIIKSSSKYAWSSISSYRKMNYKIALINQSHNFQLEVLETDREKNAFSFAENLAKEFNMKIEILKF